MQLLMAMGRPRSGSCQDPFPLKMQKVSEVSQDWGAEPWS